MKQSMKNNQKDNFKGKNKENLLYFFIKCDERIFFKNRNIIAAFLLIFAISLAAGSVAAMEPAVVRVVSANPATQTYTFACVDNGSGLTGNGIRNWFIYPEDTNIKELITSLPANKSLTYTFSRPAYYDITCEVPNPPGLNYTSLYRHSLHIDTRTSLGNPAVIPLSVGPNQTTEKCIYNGTNYTMSWFVSTYGYTGGSGNTVRYSLNTSNSTITFIPPFTPGLFDTHCLIHFTDGRPDIDFPWGVDFPKSGSAEPYIADQYGINLSGNFAPFNYTKWIALHSGGNISLNNTGNQTGNTTGNTTNTTGNTTGNNTNANQTNATAYYNLNGMPANCTGGNITIDVYSGGSRAITCTGGANSLAIQAWDKPSASSPSYFEIYKKSQNGSGINICIGPTCISSSGYAKSPPYPIIITNTSGTQSNSTGNNTGNQTGNNTGNNTGNQTNNTTYLRMQDIPATCNGGTITNDAYDGGRHITCSANSSTLSVDAWNKPSNIAPQYFEIYKKSQTGTGVQICLLTTCISGNGYAKSPMFPITG
jgi:hypothetical protein